MNFVTTMANTNANQSGILQQLGIDPLNLGLQVIAFLILLFCLSKWVFPTLSKVIDDYNNNLEESNRLITKSRKDALNASEESKRLITEARQKASLIINDAKLEAESLIANENNKAKKRAEDILQAAITDANRQIAHMRQELKLEMIDLVMAATRQVTLNTVDDKTDAELIRQAIKKVSHDDK